MAIAQSKESADTAFERRSRKGDQSLSYQVGRPLCSLLVLKWKSPNGGVGGRPRLSANISGAVGIFCLKLAAGCCLI